VLCDGRVGTGNRDPQRVGRTRLPCVGWYQKHLLFRRVRQVAAWSEISQVTQTLSSLNAESSATLSSSNSWPSDRGPGLPVMRSRRVPAFASPCAQSIQGRPMHDIRDNDKSLHAPPTCANRQPYFRVLRKRSRASSFNTDILLGARKSESDSAPSKQVVARLHPLITAGSQHRICLRRRCRQVL
jgi:hypothetical protein